MQRCFNCYVHWMHQHARNFRPFSLRIDSRRSLRPFSLRLVNRDLSQAVGPSQVVCPGPGGAPSQALIQECQVWEIRDLSGY